MKEGSDISCVGNEQQMGFMQFNPQQFDYTKMNQRKQSYVDPLQQQQTSQGHSSNNYTSWDQGQSTTVIDSNISSSLNGIDIWSGSGLNSTSIANNTSNVNNGTSMNNSNGSTFTNMGYNISSSFSASNDAYKKGGYAGVEMDQLSYQMMSLNNDISQVSPTTVNTSNYMNSSSPYHLQSASTIVDNSSKLNHNKWGGYSNYLNQQKQQQQQQQQQTIPSSNSNQLFNNNTHNGNAGNIVYRSQQNSISHKALPSSQINQEGYNNNNDLKTFEITKNNNYKYSKQASLSSKDSKSQSSSTNMTSIDPTDVENSKMKLQLKDIIISKLELELEKEREFQKIISSSSVTANGDFEIPKNKEQLYNKLVDTIQVTKKELEDTKTRLEALITAIALNPNSSSYKNGRYDEEEIAHKIISKLQMLTEENDELAKMLSYGKSKEKDIEIGLLRKKNVELREKVFKLESKLNDDKV